jgi:asparagine synthase (glutamine-hydrolysing)
MCGIAGVAGSPGNSIDRQRLAAMTDTLAHRGPDGRGVWISPDGATGLGHRRLSILDLSESGAQPMLSASGRFAIAFNGEIYNFASLRKDLDAQGETFRGHSDTEVLLAGFERWGLQATLERAAGMFAIALWDRQDQAVYLARDRIGIKPLYFGVFGGQLVFASELRPIVKWLGKLPPVSGDALASYLRLGYVPAPDSILQGVEKLAPGTFVAFRAGCLGRPQRFWSLARAVDAGNQSPLADADLALAGLEQVMQTCVQQHMVSDVPLGAFLSGGIDSSSVVATMQSLSARPIRTFSIGFHEAAYNEAGHAAQVARHLGTDHTELYVTEQDAREVIPVLPLVYDEPFADVSQIPTLLVSRLARQAVTVALSGDGGDELFAGYNRYLFVSRFWQKLSRLPRSARHAAARALGSIPPQAWDRGFATIGRALPRSLRMSLPGQKIQKIASILDANSLEQLHARLVSQWAVPEIALSREARAEVQRSFPRLEYLGSDSMDDVLRQMIWDMQTYLVDDILVKVDRASMHYGLEARVPLLDHRLVEFALRVPLSLKVRDGEGKWLLRKFLYRHVPAALVDRPKMGFGVPIGDWLRGPLRDWAGDLLSDRHLAEHGLLDSKMIAATWESHLAGSVDRGGPMWAVLMFQLWWEDAQSWV